MTKPASPAKIQWLKDGIAIVDGAFIAREEDLKYEAKQDGTVLKLVVNDVVDEDAGKYVLKVEEAVTEMRLTIRGK